MENLLNAFDFKTIMLVLFFTAVGARELIQLYRYFHIRIYGSFEKQENAKDTMVQMEKSMQSVLMELKDIDKKLSLLQVSNRDSIKSWILMSYRKYKEDNTQLDNMQMDLLERRYQHYKDQGGNSYIDEIMEELRTIYKKKGESHVSV